MKPVQLFVCTTCREGEQLAGAAFYSELQGALASNENIELVPVECLSVCTRSCTVAVSSPAKWTYVIGDLKAPVDVPAIVEYLSIYAASEHGTPPLKQRPAAIRRGTVARIPPAMQKGA